MKQFEETEGLNPAYGLFLSSQSLKGMGLQKGRIVNHSGYFALFGDLPGSDVVHRGER